MSIYKGKEPCHGCGKTGEEKPRIEKNGLCRECTEALSLGRSLIRERALERDVYLLNDLTQAFVQWYSIPIADIHAAMVDLLRTFSQFDKRYAPSQPEPQKAYLSGYAGSGTSADTIVLPKVTFEAAKRLVGLLRDACWKIREESEGYKQKIEKQYKEELNREKNRIYNDGVAHGRNLLMQLNAGEISVSDFEKPIKKY